MPTTKQLLWTSLIAVVAIAIVMRSPVAAYVTGEKKVAGVL